MIMNFQWPIPQDPAEERIINDVREFGCHIVWIGDGTPQFAFSIGLFLNYDQPEVLIFGLDSEKTCIIINDIRNLAVAGERFTAGTRTDKLLVAHNAYFLAVPFAAYQEYLGHAIWFYQSLVTPFPCVQLIWPDRMGRFPWDFDYDKRFASVQPVLAPLP